jgi:hypothetical protein
MLKALLFKRFSLGDIWRQAYVFLSRFIRSESLWLIYLRARGFADFPTDKKMRLEKIFAALVKIHQNNNPTASFFKETGRHFMCAK